jgi:hypothetical protein
MSTTRNIIEGIKNVTSEVAPINSPALTGTPTINGTPISTFGNGFKNHIIDGRFDFWYEGTNQTTGGYGSDTMWVNGNEGSTKTHTRQAFAVGGTFPDGKLMPMYYSRTVVNSVAGAGNTTYKDQRLEDVTRLAGKTVTFSFYAKADANKNISISFDQHFGTGGTPSERVTSIGTQKIALTTTWTKYSRTFTIPSIAGKTLGTNGVHTSFSLMRFWFEAGSNNDARTDNLGQQSGTFDIAMVQLEEGSVATDFEWNGTAVEKTRVDRYFQIISWTDRITATAAGQYLQATVNFSTMRVVPTATYLAAYSIINASYSGFFPTNFNGGRGQASSAGSGDSYVINALEKLDARQ